MSLTPYLRGFWEDPWEGQSQPSRLYDQHFGTVVPDEYFLRESFGPLHRRAPLQTGLSEVINNDKEFRVNVDVQHFKPEELEVKTKDNRVLIHAKHEDRPDEHGFIMREFTRQYILPRDVDPTTVTSTLNKEGVLVLKAPKKALEAPKENKILIKRGK